MLDLDSLITSLEASQEDVEARKQEMLDNVGSEMANKVKRFTPVDTGNLQSSIHYEIESESVVNIVSTVEYAPYVDQGHASGDTFVPGSHMFDRAFLEADTVLDYEAERFIRKINLLG